MTKEVKEKAPVWVDYDICKQCKLCIRACPVGVLCMIPNIKSVHGIKLIVDNIDYCTGCSLCEQSCPDRAIHVLPKEQYSNYTKSTQHGKNRQKEILENDHMKPKEKIKGGVK